MLNRLPMQLVALESKSSSRTLSRWIHSARSDQRRAARLYWFQILSIVAALIGVVATTIVAIATITAAAS